MLRLELSLQRVFHHGVRALSRLASGVGLGAALCATACGSGFDPVSQVKGLRVLGVQKDTPYPLDGAQNQSVALHLLWHDAKAKLDASGNPDRTIEVAWLPCYNPGSDLYYGCFDPAKLDLSALKIGGDTPLARDTFSVAIPPNIVDTHAPAPPGQPSYGLVYVFFALCAGSLTPNGGATGAPPFVCLDANGKALGPDDFVVGYTSLYVFRPKSGNPPILNHNPAVTGVDLAGTSLDVSQGPVADTCVGTDCIPEVLQDVDCSDASNAWRCFPACAADGSSSCPGIPIRPLVDPSTVEPDEVSAEYYGRNVSEQMWIDYYVDRGDLKSSTRLLNDAVRGWNEDFGTVFYAPKDPGNVTLWAVVHDSRGGMDWVRVRIGIQ